MTKKLLLLLLLLSQVSCMTMKMWDKTYDETFYKFSISSRGDRVALIGQDFHYVFDDEFGELRNLLLWRSSDLLFIDVENTYFSVDRNNRIQGYLTVECFFNNIHPSGENLLISEGFEREAHQPLTKKFKIAGMRHLPTDELDTFLPTLDRPYIVPIHYTPTPSRRVTDVILTPLTLAADLLLFVGKAILLPFHDR